MGALVAAGVDLACVFADGFKPVASSASIVSHN